MATTILAAGTTAAQSTEASLAVGESATLFLAGAAGAVVPDDAVVDVQFKRADATWTRAYTMSAGAVEAKFAAILPLSTISQNGEAQEVTRSDGDIDAVIQLAKDAGQAVDAKTIGGLFAALDVSEQSPFEAMARLGLQIIAE